MKRAASCKHRQAVKNIQCEEKLFKSHLHSSKLGKRVEKHATSWGHQHGFSAETSQFLSNTTYFYDCVANNLINF